MSYHSKPSGGRRHADLDSDLVAGIAPPPQSLDGGALGRRRLAWQWMRAWRAIAQTIDAFGAEALRVFLINLSLGWTLLGWITALVWAVSRNTRRNAELDRRAFLRYGASSARRTAAAAAALRFGNRWQDLDRCGPGALVWWRRRRIGRLDGGGCKPV